MSFTKCYWTKNQNFVCCDGLGLYLRVYNKTVDLHPLHSSSFPSLRIDIRTTPFCKYVDMDDMRGHQLFCLCVPRTASNLTVNPMILRAKCSAAWQQTVSIIHEVDISGVCEPLCGVRRCRDARTGAPEIPLWMMCGANAAVVPVFRCLVPSPTLLLCATQFRVAKSPHHPAEIDEKCSHDHYHERVRLHHGFGDWRCHLLMHGSDCQCERRFSGWTTGSSQFRNTRHPADLKANDWYALSLNKMYGRVHCVSCAWSNTTVKPKMEEKKVDLLNSQANKIYKIT